MKFQLLPSTFDENGGFSQKQHLACFVVDDCVAIDAGSLAMAASEKQKKQIRDVVLTHAHLDHISGLPLFIDDLFSSLSKPIRVHATAEVIEILERDVFNWEVYPKFSELRNDSGAVLEYHPFQVGKEFTVKHLRIKAVKVNHQVPAVGFVVSDNRTAFAFSGDTTEMSDFWETVNNKEKINALLIECALPNELSELARLSHHLTLNTLQREIKKSLHPESPIYIINMKPMHRAEIVGQIQDLKIQNLNVLEVGKIYNF